MSAGESVVALRRGVRIKGVALPVEHGSWGFLFEPLVAAFAIAFSPSAIWIAFLVIGAFLTRQPLKIYLTDRIAGRSLPQTSVALKFVFFYGAFFLVGLFGSLFFARPASLLPFVFILPFAIYQIYCDVSRKSREMISELTGAVAISSSAAAIALADNWTLVAALALWAIFVARLVPSILYVRNRLRLEKGKEFSRSSPIFAHLFALGFIVVLVYYGLSPGLTVVMFSVLLVRTVWGLSSYRRKVKAMKIGIWEVIYGSLTVLSVIIGHYLKTA